MRRRCLGGCGRWIPNGARCAFCLAAQKQPYHTAEYQDIRPRILLRDAYACQIKAKGCTRIATTVDHINADKTDNREANLQAACHECNSGKRDR